MIHIESAIHTLNTGTGQFQGAKFLRFNIENYLRSIIQTTTL